MTRHILLLLLFVAICSVTAAVDENTNTTVSTQSGLSIQFMGRSPQFRLYPNPNTTDYIQIKLGRLVELDAQKKPVRGRRLPPLVNLRASLTQGVKEVDGSNVSFVKMALNASELQFDDSVSCSANQTQSGLREVALTAFYGFAKNTTFPYGANNTVTVQPNSFKFNIEASSWPFCSTGNSLSLDLVIKTSNNGTDQPLMVDENGNITDVNSTVADATTVSSSANSTSAPATRKLLKENGNGPAGNGASSAGPAENGNGPAGNGASSAGPAADKKNARLEDSKKPENEHAGHAGAVNVTRPMLGGKVKDGPRRGPATKMAAFLMSSEKAAALNLASYAYDAVDGNMRSNVTIYMRQALDEDKLSGDNNTVVSLVTLEFPYFTSLYYDPDVAFANATDVGYENVTVMAASLEVANDTKAKNGAVGASVRSGTALLGLAAFAVGMMLL